MTHRIVRKVNFDFPDDLPVLPNPTNIRDSLFTIAISLLATDSEA